MKNNYWYLILTTFALWALNEIFYFKPDFFFVSLALAVIIITFYIRALARKKSEKFWPVYVLTPVLFYLSFSFYSAIIVSQFWIQAIFLLNAWFIFSYLKNLYYYFSFGAPERESRLKRLLVSGAFLSTFALASNLYGLPIFLSWPFFLLLIAFMVICLGLFGQFFVFSKNVDREQKIFLGINILVFAEFAGVLFFLPLNFNILGLMVALVFYFLIMLNDLRVEYRLNFKNVKWPLIILSAVIILTLLSARWL
ncbi:MAG: hypothetical protein WCN88_02150 [Candidatus Falkowbacteria bacterium]